MPAKLRFLGIWHRPSRSEPWRYIAEWHPREKLDLKAPAP
jgi:hypothetical protein